MHPEATSGSSNEILTKRFSRLRVSNRVAQKTELRIGDLSRATGTRVETIRWYEKVGLIASPARTVSNYRAYDATALTRLSFIRRARDLGFSLDQVRALLDLSDDRIRNCGLVDVMAESHLQEIDRKIADLQALRKELSGLLSSCRGGTVPECHILDALAPRTA